MPQLTGSARRSALVEQKDTTKQDGAGYRHGFQTVSVIQTASASERFQAEGTGGALTILPRCVFPALGNARLRAKLARS
jgi:hypothetical protein